MGKPVTVNPVTSYTEYIGIGGERRELKHLSTFRSRKQASDFPSSGERTGKSLNRSCVIARKRCMTGVVGSDWNRFRPVRRVTNPAVS